MTKPVILIPEPFPQSALDTVPDGFEIRLGDPTKAMGEDDLIVALDGVSAIAITSREYITRRVMENARDLKVIGKSGAFPANVDVAAAREQCVELVWTPTANVQSVAEMTIMLMLTLVKRIPEQQGLLDEGKWRSADLLGRELAHMTVGLIGLGHIGRAVAHLLQAIGAKVVGTDPGLSVEDAAKLGIEWLPLKEVFARGDIVSLHCESNEKTRGIVGKAAFDAMRDGTYLVNTARGPLVDGPALLDALESGRIIWAALDVFPEEPVKPGDALADHPRIIATPHISAFTEEALFRETSGTLEDIVNVLTGKPTVHTPLVR